MSCTYVFKQKGPGIDARTDTASESKKIAEGLRLDGKVYEECRGKARRLVYSCSSGKCSPASGTSGLGSLTGCRDKRGRFKRCRSKKRRGKKR